MSRLYYIPRHIAGVQAGRQSDRTGEAKPFVFSILACRDGPSTISSRLGCGVITRRRPSRRRLASNDYYRSGGVGLGVFDLCRHPLSVQMSEMRCLAEEDAVFEMWLVY